MNMASDQINEVYDKITSIFYNYKDWKLNEENKLDSFLKIAFKKLNINLDNITEKDQRKLFKEFIKFFDYKLLDKVDYLFNINLAKNCIDKLWNSMFKKYIDKEWSDYLLLFSKAPYCKYLNIDNLKSKINLIWEKYKNKSFIQEIMEEEELTEDEIKQKFINSDPTNKATYLNWILNSFENGGIERLEDLGRISQAISKILLLNESKKTKIDILKYNGLELEDVIDSYRDFFEEREKDKLDEKQVKSETEYLYEGKEIRIISPKTERSAKYYGRRTRWCTAADKDNQFENYTEDGNLYIILIKNPSSDYPDEKYQLFFEMEEFMNEKDEKIDLFELAEKYQEVKNIINYIRLIHPMNKHYIVYFDNQIELIKRDNIQNIYLFNNNLIDQIPDNVRSLILSKTFDKSIDNLPSTIEKLQINGKFNQKINKLPSNLIHLQLTGKFDNYIINFPNHLEYLKFGDIYSKELSNLPVSLKSLTIGLNYEYKLNLEKLPNLIELNVRLYYPYLNYLRSYNDENGDKIKIKTL